MMTLEAKPTSVSARPRDPLYPLSEFLDSPPSWDLEVLDGVALPEPYRTLLVHDSDMTSTLERHHGDILDLRVLARRLREDQLDREVLLVGRNGGQPVEFGAIRIDLAAFPAAARPAIVAGHRPLGALLAKYDIPYTSRPRLYFRLPPSPQIAAALEIAAPAELYGRQNVLRTPGGRALADVVEILPPAVA